MQSEWIIRSQIVGGLILDGKVAADAVPPEILHPPYDALVRLYRDGKIKEEIWDQVGYYHYQDAVNAAEAVSTSNGLDHIELCKWAMIRTQAGERLEPVIRRWKEGRTKEGDMDLVIQAIEEMERNVTRAVPLGEVEAIPGAWKLTGYEPFDNYFGGVPADSLTVIGGPPGTGKTSIISRLAIDAAERGEVSLIFSLEMRLRQLKYRMRQMVRGRWSKKNWNKIIGYEKIFDLNTIVSEAIKYSAIEDNLGMVVIDFADMVRSGWRNRSNRVAVIDEMYRTFAELSLKLEIPVIVLSQLNEQYVGGRPRVNHLRGSRLIEALAAMIVLLYNPDLIDVSQKTDALVCEPGIGWMILGKSRYGFGKEIGAKGNFSNTIGAVQVPWDGAKGWNDRGIMWQPLGSA